MSGAPAKNSWGAGAGVLRGESKPGNDEHFDLIPAEMQAVSNWVLWKLVPRSPKPTKVPYSARTQRCASVTNPETWATYDEVVSVLATDISYAGIGFVFTDDDPFVGVDLDNCADRQTGYIASWAQEVVAALNSYTEWTPSGKGLHVLVQGTFPETGRKKGDIEVYRTGRFFTVTGSHLAGTPTTTQERTTELAALHQRHFGKGHPDDDSIEARFQIGKLSDHLTKLFAGSWQDLDYPSQSEADLALVSALAKQCQGDAAQIDRLFRKSGLMRDKWDEKRGTMSYGQRTIEQALGAAVSSLNGQTNSSQLLDTLNKSYAVVQAGGKVRILKEECGDNVRTEISFLSRADFSTLVENIPSPIRKCSTAKWWLKESGRREYARVDFLPGGAPADTYNLWRGFGVTPAPGETKKWWSFVRDVIAAGDESVYTYLRRYCAHIVQRSGELPGVAIVLRGGQGTGKNTFVDSIGKLVGMHYTSVSSLDRVVGRFNAYFKETLVLHANEALWGGNRASAGVLKSLITDPERMIEPKGVDAISVKNYTRTFVSSNEDWAVPVDADDRRYLIVDVNPQHAQDHQYFAELHKELDSGGYAAIMHDLMHEDLTGFQPRDKPKTSTGLDMKIQTARSPDRFWYDCLHDGGRSLPYGLGLFDFTLSENSSSSIRKTVIYKAYTDWCSQTGVNRPGF